MKFLVWWLRRAVKAADNLLVGPDGSLERLKKLFFRLIVATAASCAAAILAPEVLAPAAKWMLALSLGGLGLLLAVVLVQACVSLLTDSLLG